MKKFSNTFIIFLLLLPFMEPDYFVSIPVIDKIYTIMKVLIIGIVFIYFFWRTKISKMTIAIGIFQLIYVVIAVINKFNIVSSITFFGSVFCMLLIIEYYIKKDSLALIKGLLYHLSILSIINLLSILLFPNGIFVNSNNYPVWFLGIDNNHIFILLPAMCVSLLYSYVSGNRLKKSTILVLFISLLQIFIRWSATSVVGSLMIIIYLLFHKTFTKYKVFSFSNLMILFLFFSIGIVFFRIQNLFSFFIVDVLHKNLTLTGRIYIWDHVIQMIKLKPFLGYGVAPIMKIHFPTYTFNAVHAHNLILNILYNGGITLLFSFGYLNYLLIKQLNKYKGNELSTLFSFFIFIFYIVTIAEVNNMKFMFIIFTLAYSIDKFIGLKSSEAS